MSGHDVCIVAREAPVTKFFHSPRSAALRAAEADARTHIAVADDSDEMRRLMTDVLTSAGYRVTAVPSGSELLGALERMRAEDVLPALIVCEVHMPEVSGLLVLGNMIAAGISVPVILASACCDDRTLNQAARLGAACVLQKPFDVDVLRSAVYFVLEAVQRSR